MNAPAATVEALMFGLRDGIEAFNPDTLRRLSELSEEQLRAVCERVQNSNLTLRPRGQPMRCEGSSIFGVYLVAKLSPRRTSANCGRCES